ncbi:MAG: hypothetical protein K2P84_13725, partial [Undibacterium sp.]|nr:hypothetical protein [Undibacterium sp.]
VLLHSDYAALPTIMRSEADSQNYFQWMVLAHVFIAFSVVWIYERGCDSKPWLGQGLRFGLALSFLTIVPTYMIYYVVQPLPETLVIKQIAFDLVRTLGLGLLLGWLYRKA